ncbi:HD family phosphohydrolase [Cellulosilyticum sp. I15G10I2]|uniref:HD family phosphohydrolase n=1 Tax=Cellulosilyticum sp. I15G10I2 TaxID=1892843 RepID=UPI00085C7A1C|nr:HDIG domain-containing metalloprotein [Cellulosilyticum sp. I15G10I2]
MMKKQIYLKVISLIICIAVTFLAIVSGSFFTRKVSLQIGQIARETIYAPFQVENEMATNRKKELAEKGVLSIYKVDIKVQEKAIADIEMLFDYTLSVQTTDIAERLNKSPLEVLRGRSPIGLYKDEYETLLGMRSEDLNYMKEACIYIAVKLFENGIQSGDVNKVLEIKSMLEETSLNVTYQKVAEGIITAIIKPNVVLDEVATNEAKKLEREKVDPIFILQGETIIDKGTRVTEETYTILGKVGYLDTNKNTKYKNYLGISLLIALILFFVLRYIKLRQSIKVLQDKQVHLIMILYILSIGIARMMLGRSFVYLPLAVAPIIIALLVDVDIALIINMLLVLFASIIFKGDILFFVYFIITGTLSVLIVGNMQERKRTMKNALLIGTIQLITYIALKLFIGADITINVIIEASIAFIIGFISVVVVVGTLPLLESAFGFVTPLQLLELTNPNQPVLKRLLLEATGTYYHSLLVANLAETAADAIGANPLMARVGGYYHDIGKLTSSNYFKENQNLDNPHDTMDPLKSCQIIISHVANGLSLATQYNLPVYIKDMIKEHHGTSVMQYFYIKAKEQSGEFIKEEQFRYKGPKPKTREAALVMLADVVEATTRSMQDKLGAEITIEKIVRKMVKQKLEEGQLDACELYISDIDKIIDSFSKMLKGMYHERIQYPERNES